MEGVRSTTLRRKFLEKGDSANLADLLHLARVHEQAQQQALNMGGPFTDAVHKLFARSRLIVHEATPNALSAQEVEEASKDDLELQQVRQQLSNNKWDKSSKTFFPIRDELCSIGYLVLRGTRIVIPKALRSRCIKLAHTGHLGIVGTKQRLGSKVWWPGIDKEVEHFVKSCHGCQLVESALPPEPLQVTELPSGPWQDIGIDFLGPLDSGHYILVVIDYYSRYYDAGITKKTSQKVIDTLDRLFSMHGLPKTLKSDNAANFTSQEFESYLQKNGIVHKHTTPLHPAANGEVE